MEGEDRRENVSPVPGTLVILDINWALSVTELHVNR